MNTRVRNKCFVPSCCNSKAKNPELYFVTVPVNVERRKKWFKAVGINKNPTTHSRHVCCEQHFDLEKDAENWCFFKFMGSSLKLHKDVVPHLNLDHYNPKATPQLSASDKQRKLESIEELNAKYLNAKYLKPPVFVDCSRIDAEDENVQEIESECNEKKLDSIKHVDVVQNKHDGMGYTILVPIFISQ